MFKTNFATKQSLRANCNSPQKQVPMNAMHCSGQRGDNFIGSDPRRPKINRASNRVNFICNHIMNPLLDTYL